MYKSLLHHEYPFRRFRYGISLVEILVVVALIALLMAVLLPSLSAVREQARQTSCASNLKQIGMAAFAYGSEHRNWIVGSPNTSGNGARSGFADGNYQGDPDHYPALHVFDWVSPLMKYVSVRPPQDPMLRYAEGVKEVFRCPSNCRQAGPVNFPALEKLIPADSLAPSYATSRYFTYVGESAINGDINGRLWWTEDCVPANYVPKLERIRRQAAKAFLADAHVVSKPKGQISNANWGYTSHGAWRWHDESPVTYRGNNLGEEIWRHTKAINILAFDNHVERQKEADSLTRNGYGTWARRIHWWFPSGTDTEKLPSRQSASKEPPLIVP